MKKRVNKYDSKKREAKIAEMDKLLANIAKHTKYLKEINKKIKTIDADCKTLESYYFSEWLDDYNNFKSEKSYCILLQDPIHNALQEIHEEKVKILKKIVSKIR